jgi:acyl-coenzyme A thioesterase PaaI-like protein
MDIRTHEGIAAELCGTPTEVSPGKSVVAMTTTAIMAADDMGLVHGGFLFGMADYAAMLAVNDPHVVLGASETKFIKPVKVGETITATAVVKEEVGKKRIVDVTVSRDGTAVLTGSFACFVPDKHVLR